LHSLFGIDGNALIGRRGVKTLLERLIQKRLQTFDDIGPLKGRDNIDDGSQRIANLLSEIVKISLRAKQNRRLLKVFRHEIEYLNGLVRDKIIDNIRNSHEFADIVLCENAESHEQKGSH
jgi:hypothetical protein